MIKRGSIINPEIQAVLSSSNRKEGIKKLFADMHPYDIFVLCEDLDNTQIAECIRALGVPAGIELFEQFDDDRRKEIFSCFSGEWMADILEEMSHDERADFVKNLSPEKMEEILPLVARAERIDIKKLIEYKEGTAGSILTTDYASLPPNISVKEAIEKIKLQAFNRETIYYIYVIDSDRKLLGFVSLRDILVAPSQKLIEDIMHKNVISANVNDDKEEVANKLSDYNFLAIPIVDNDERLVGIVTVDDVVDVVIEETTEDIYKYGAAGEYIDYMKANPFNVARQRAFWLLFLIIVGSVSAFILQKNTYLLETVVALSFFTPLLLGAGGNAGTQSSTVVIRGLAVGEIEMEDVFKVIKKEMSVGICVGTFMALVASVMASWLDKDPRLGFTVGMAMIFNVTLATSLGAFLPILFKKFKLDPALMSGPFITCIVDVVSLIVYFKIATIIFA
ncbi:MAG: magnesium transporter [Candidatus Omnitrophica bacterium]|nr:magnesium transporter [Candidatus Omnitrophota bacterium]MCB9747208.1 magnesium transporter [Candidatus Omnitrophota bacterium]